MESSVEDIREQEEDIFEELEEYDLLTKAPFQIAQEHVKQKAKQQLAVSVDSPFSRRDSEEEIELRKLKEVKARALNNETKEIRRQLELVKGRLAQLNNGNRGGDSLQTTEFGSANERFEEEDPKPKPAIRRSIKKCQKASFQAKSRPLTGKADCPNCTCDRRHSVCDQCICLASKSLPINGENLATFKENKQRFNYEDERPIRPAREKLFATVETVDDVVVPGRVYNIGKSLNQKRTKLAQAIEDLNVMMDQVKEKGNKLDQERKVVQLYKDQWKFGPSIGGPKASSRETLGNKVQQRRNYESRLDPNLARDTKSLMGFQQTNASLKLRQYPANNRRINVSQKDKSTPLRSKSLESLKIQPIRKRNYIQKAISNFDNGKASSELELATATNKVIDLSNEDDDNDVQSVNISDRQSPQVSVANSNTDGERSQIDINEKIQRMTWIPVFGETEIKTVKRVAPKRKTQVVGSQTGQSTYNSRSSASHLNTPTKITPKSNLVKQTQVLSCNRNTIKASVEKGSNRVMVEAKRKLKFASDLLAEEQRDSSTKNQLIVNKTTPVPKPRTKPKNVASNLRGDDVSGSSTMPINEVKSQESCKEIERLEQMVNEQQKLLAKLTQQQTQDHRQVFSPVTVSCSSPCCHHSPLPTRKNSSSSYRLNAPLIGLSGSHKPLINVLKDKLNKSKNRLARTLEAEKEKHQQLKLKVDSSLRRQSDLRNENELLKQSLSKCIDTCLKDISSTFESLSDTLSESVDDSSRLTTVDMKTLSEEGGSTFENAAQLIQDNRHLKQMKNHVEAIESQRRGIFEELKREKQQRSHLEAQLRDSQAELERLSRAKQDLDGKIVSKKDDINRSSEVSISSPLQDSSPSTSQGLTSDLTRQFEQDKSELDESYNSVEVYKKYIESITPDIESIRHERKLILSEFDNIKKMLSEMDK